MVDLRHARFRLDDDHAVHAAGDVLSDHRCRAVVDVHARVECLELERAGLTRRDLHHLGATAWAGYGVQVDAVRHTGVGRIAQVDLHRVAFAYAQHWTRHSAVEGPVLVGHSVGHLGADIRGRQVELDVRRLGAGDRWSDLRQGQPNQVG